MLVVYADNVAAELCDDPGYAEELTRLVEQLNVEQGGSAGLNKAAVNDSGQDSNVDVAAGYEAHDLLALYGYLIEHYSRNGNCASALCDELLLLDERQDSRRDLVVGNGNDLVNVLAAYIKGMLTGFLYLDSVRDGGNIVKALDLAVIKAEGNFACAALGSVESVRAGESVIAIGTPLALQFQHTVTRGIVSAVDRTLQVPSEGSTAFLEQLIQTDAAINPGNSGGPLLNAKGEVIGIITVRVEEAAGIGFAIPIDIAKPILQHFIAEGSFTAPKLGAYLFDSEIARFYDENSTMTAGLYVIGVEPNSPAERAGLREGDILLSADGRTCRMLLDLRYQIFAHRVGEKMALRVLRGAESLDISVRLAAE